MNELSRHNFFKDFDLANISTYQAGVIQASAFRVTKHHTTAVLGEFDLTGMQWFTIGTILAYGPQGVRLGELAKRLDTTLAYMTTTVNYLESRKILSKKSEAIDARAKTVVVRPQYKRTCLRIEKKLRQHLREVLYDNLTREELTCYIKVLYKLSAMR